MRASFTLGRVSILVVIGMILIYLFTTFTELAYSSQPLFAEESASSQEYRNQQDNIDPEQHAQTTNQDTPPKVWRNPEPPKTQTQQREQPKQPQEPNQPPQKEIQQQPKQPLQPQKPTQPPQPQKPATQPKQPQRQSKQPLQQPKESKAEPPKAPPKNQVAVKDEVKPGTCWKNVPIYKGLNCLGYFEILGFAKGGSSFVRSMMRQLPEVESDRSPLQSHLVQHIEAKDYDYFFDFQMKNAPNITGKRQIMMGKGFPSIIYNDEGLIEHYSKINPTVKLIALIREPVTRLYSHYGMMTLEHHIVNLTDADFDDYVKVNIEQIQKCLKTTDKKWYECDPTNVIHRGMFYNTLSLYFKYFSRENFMILTQEDMLRDSRGAMRKIAAWLDLEVPDDWPRIHPVNVGTHVRAPISDYAKKTLYDFYHPYNVKLEGLLNTTFSWT